MPENNKKHHKNLNLFLKSSAIVYTKKNSVGLSTTAMFGDLGGYIFGNVRDKTSNIT